MLFGGFALQRITVGLGLLVIIVSSGCVSQNEEVILSRPEQLELETRSLDLLERAAKTQVDVLVCNAIEALVRVAPRVGEPHYRSAARSDSPLVRFAGYVALGDTQCRKAIDQIRKGTQDVDPRVRLAAAYAAVRCGHDGYTRVIVETLRDAPDENLRADAAMLFGRIGDPRAVKWLRAALRWGPTEKSKRVQLHVHWALAMLGEEDAVDHLIRYSQGDATTRVDALLILAELGHPKTREVLRYHLMNDQYVESQLVAARGLGKLGSDEGYVFSKAHVNYRAKDPPPDDTDASMRVRSLAIHALAEIGRPGALGVLRDVARDETDPRLQVAACYAICRIIDQNRR